MTSTRRPLYYVTATIDRATPDGWGSSRALPTFVLDSGVQGILSAAHAARVAASLLRDVSGPDCTLYVCATLEVSLGSDVASLEILPGETVHDAAIRALDVRAAAR